MIQVKTFYWWSLLWSGQFQCLSILSVRNMKFRLPFMACLVRLSVSFSTEGEKKNERTLFHRQTSSHEISLCSGFCLYVFSYWLGDPEHLLSVCRRNGLLHSRAADQCR